MKAVFVHGGPGLNSNPEDQILSNDFLNNNFDIMYWNEPKVFSSQDYYNEVLDSLVRFINSIDDNSILLIGHSFGCNLILNVMPLIKDKINSICFLSPVLDINEADTNIIKYGLKLLKSSNAESAVKLETMIPNLTKRFDETKIQALLLAMSSDLFHHYFSDDKSFYTYFNYLQDENEFRIEDYIKIKQSIPISITDLNEIFSIPLLIIFGQKDPVCNPIYEEKVIRKYFSNITLYTLENISHYPHIDATDFFFEALKTHIKTIS